MKKNPSFGESNNPIGTKHITCQEKRNLKKVLIVLKNNDLAGKFFFKATNKNNGLIP